MAARHSIKTLRNFGRKLKQIREIRGYTQGELAAMADLSTNAIISSYERGEKMPTIDTIHKLAECLDVHPIILLDQTEYSDRHIRLIISILEQIKINPDGHRIKTLEDLLPDQINRESQLN